MILVGYYYFPIIIRLYSGYYNIFKYSWFKSWGNSRHISLFDCIVFYESIYFLFSYINVKTTIKILE